MENKSFDEARERAIENLKAEGILKTESVIKAMLKVPREEFLPNNVKRYAYVDVPLPIGHGQTTSALHMTAIFCEHGELKLGEKVLEVGGGCGYMSCVYAEVVAPSDQPKSRWGHVWAIEIVKELYEYSKKKVEKTSYAERVTLIHGDGSLGLKEYSPYDVIIVTSAAPRIPREMIDQLSPNGRLLIPVGSPGFYQELIRVRKRKDGTIEKESLGGVAFVPMRGKAGWE
ncbi:MAG: protein-L-isoaspartate(D-aspartate) O-methyltransferase [Candidatus Bathyarchaeia archaeon]